MTALLTPPRPAPVAMRPYRWTNDDFVDLAKAGYFQDQFVMLIDGVFIHMPPPNPPHDTAVSLADYLLKDLFRPGYVVRVQSGFPTGLDTNPMPDLAVVAGSPRDFAVNPPRTAVLVVEVSDTSFAYDSGEKANLYAAAGVPEYWVIDVNAPQLLVYRDPTPDPAAPRGHRYATTLTLTAADTVTPTTAPNAVVRVTDLLP